MSELSVDLDAAFRSETDVRGGSGYAVAATLYSPPIAYDWRLFASSGLAQESLTEGDITLQRYATGVELRRRDLAVEAAVAYNAWDGTSRGSARLGATWTVDDAWTLAAKAEKLARDTPLRALKNGVTADAFGASLAWRQSESREARLGFDALDFSDGNFRLGGSARYAERLAAGAHFHLDAVAALAASGNGKTGVPYYAPAADALATLGFEAGHVLYRRYDRVWEHGLTLAPGGYWQQGFGTTPAVGLRYEHRLQLDDTIEIAGGIGFGSQSFDGDRENAASFFGRLRMRF
jgi:biofilm PGA synthesis protein PgaA